jgi:serine/threonine protein kinase
MLKSAHPSVISVVDVGISSPYIKINGAVSYVNYVVMPLAERGELFGLLRETGKLSEELARHAFLGMLRGLEHMHQIGIAHRDIKTENLLIESDFQIKLADYGFAAEIFDASRRKYSFDSSERVGSPSYNAPEQVNQTEPIYDA